MLMLYLQRALTDDLLRPKYLTPDRKSRLEGHCYVAAEALWHLRGRIDTPMVARCPDGDTHWWLRRPDGRILDPTASQFLYQFPYETGRGSGFLTRQPSRRATVVIDRVLDALREEATR